MSSLAKAVSALGVRPPYLEKTNSSGEDEAAYDVTNEDGEDEKESSLNAVFESHFTSLLASIQAARHQCKAVAKSVAPTHDFACCVYCVGNVPRLT